MELDKKRIAKRIKKLRLERGFNAVEIAKIAGISGSAISKIESGVNAPDLKTLNAIADYFDVPVDYLLCKGIYEDMDLLKKYLPMIFSAAKESLLNYFNIKVIDSIEASSDDLKSEIRIANLLSVIYAKIVVDEKENQVDLYYRGEDSDNTQNILTLEISK